MNSSQEIQLQCSIRVALDVSKVSSDQLRENR